MNDAPENTPKLLLHACCGPCSLEPVRTLRERGIEPHIYYANPNIHPAKEYAHRLSTIRAWAAESGLELTEGAYDVAAWDETAGRVGNAAREKFGVIAGNVEVAKNAEGKGAANTESAGELRALSAHAQHAEGELTHNAKAEAARQARCRACYRIRFEESARFAAEHGFDALGTTLSVSPYQYTEIIREELERACESVGISPLFEDYRPYYDEATRRSREAGMYRQNFCGCRFSDEEAQTEREARKAVRKARKAAEAAAHEQERAAEKEQRDARKAERRAYDEKQARKRAIRKSLREAN